ncbi:MBL fold hydrolase [Thermodesulfomicrobium sp. WS]|uniref:MBL fold metallo-hydrolase RNA specificity domain-containing protein n=1 Tax=Thermodesulfomicrobium sp. WS TaxID=3004129 RepID=UPI0024913C22|nr:MBL fold metallo-hydrolase [Thermodesulfomicrobium sp. WS]BDV01491.1 MBL fold hydrolase [Thermodesulfomicrobium sp. WS]
MKVTFLGAARTVTGSCYVLETGATRFAVDCGMHQGNRAMELRNWDEAGRYRPRELDFILLTHAHVDHCGLLPRLVKQGFAGPVYTTAPSRDLVEILLEDSAYIQEMEARWRSSKKQRAGGLPEEPLYTVEDAVAAVQKLQVVEYDREFSPKPGVRVMFRNAGHILGSAFVEIWVQDEGRESKCVFSGDLGRPHQLLVPDPWTIDQADFLFLESTYGNRDHKNEDSSRQELAEAIAYSYRHGQKVLIPSFAVERTQEILFSLHLLAKEGKLPADMPVFLDSPLAIKATEIFRKHARFYDDDARAVLDAGEDPLSVPGLQLAQTVEESREINTRQGPAIVIAGSGMANAGRIKHHLRHNIWREGASVVFVGFQAQGTPGRRIVDGAPSIRILGEQLAVRAKVFTIGGFSAHAGQSQLLEWLGHFRSPSMQVYLIHGEYAAQQEFARLIKERLGYTVHIPDYLDECTLEPGGVFQLTSHHDLAPRIDWDFLLEETHCKLAQVQDRVRHLDRLGYTSQVEIRGTIVDINSKLLEILSELRMVEAQPQASQADV